MSMTRLFSNHRPLVIGMVHLQALPGAPSYEGVFEQVLEHARRDARALVEGGVHAIMVENFFDIPFTRHRVAAETVAAMTVAVAEIRRITGLPIGVNVLRNDGCSAMAIAVATGAQFIRVNVLASARLTDQGIIEGISYELSRLRATLGGDDITILADLDVKHSRPLAPCDPLLEAEELVERSGAGGLIVTGATTGRPVDEEQLRILADHVDVPLVIGSGVTDATAPTLAKHARGLIVGTSLKESGRIERPVDVSRVKALMTAVNEA